MTFLDTQPLIELRSVSVAYPPDHQVLFDISFCVKKADRILIVGPNGSGKSTLLKSIVGMCDVISGMIYYNGDNITGMNTAKLLKYGIAYLPQGDRVFPELTVRENLEIILFGKTSRQRKSAIERAVSEFDFVKTKLEHKASTLSGGEQQIVALARVIVTGASVLLLDEPTSGLSAANSEIVVDAIRRIIGGRIMTILIAEHDVSWASKICDQYIAIRTGRLDGLGKTSSLLQDNDLLRDIFL